MNGLLDVDYDGRAVVAAVQTQIFGIGAQSIKLRNPSLGIGSQMFGVVDLASRRWRSSPTRLPESETAVRFLPDGEHVAISTSGEPLSIWELPPRWPIEPNLGTPRPAKLEEVQSKEGWKIFFDQEPAPKIVREGGSARPIALDGMAGQIIDCYWSGNGRLFTFIYATGLQRTHVWDPPERYEPIVQTLVEAIGGYVLDDVGYMKSVPVVARMHAWEKLNNLTAEQLGWQELTRWWLIDRFEPISGPIRLPAESKPQPDKSDAQPVK